MSDSVAIVDSRTLILYGTEGCHLCEEALALVLGEPSLAGWALEYVDIANDEQLLATFAERIPVLALPTNDQCLNWPFTAIALSAFVASLTQA